jgi:hypothetical protein
MNEVGAVLLSGFVAVAVALWGIWSQRHIARTRATIEFINGNERDRDVMEARRCFIRLAKANGGLAMWAEEDKERDEETQSIRVVLNEYELIAIGLQRGIFDEGLYRLWFRSGAIRYWSYAKPFVDRVRARTGNQALWKEFEALAKKMEAPAK